jgi:hypothetical protein
MALLKASDFARMICEYLKTLPDCEVDDPKKVQKFLGLLDDEFKMGVEWAVKRDLIMLTAPVTQKVSVFSAFTTEDTGEMAAEVA